MARVGIHFDFTLKKLIIPKTLRVLRRIILFRKVCFIIFSRIYNSRTGVILLRISNLAPRMFLIFRISLIRFLWGTLKKTFVSVVILLKRPETSFTEQNSVKLSTDFNISSNQNPSLTFFPFKKCSFRKSIEKHLQYNRLYNLSYFTESWNYSFTNHQTFRGKWIYHDHNSNAQQ